MLRDGYGPRERLLAGQGASLTDAELLAAIWQTGRQGVDVVRMAQGVLEQVGGLAGLLSAYPGELQALAGIGPAKAAQVLAVVELTRRLMRLDPQRRAPVGSPADVYELLGPELGHQDREQFVVVLLDSRHRVMGVHGVSVGELDRTPVHPREVFKPAIRLSSAAIIVAHNHPSGDPTPSLEDREVTRRLVEAGRLLGIEVLDHVVIGRGRYASLKELGWM
ncbi:MAG TPA: DNA repair protein RadC [Limnochordales bacterium]